MLAAVATIPAFSMLAADATSIAVAAASIAASMVAFSASSIAAAARRTYSGACHKAKHGILGHNLYNLKV